MATATGSAPQAAAPQAAPASQRPRTRLAASTPRAIGLLMVVLVVASLAWGAVGGWTASQHASAASGVVNTGEPLSFDARQMYQALSDADVTATTAFLSGPQEPLAMRQRYQADIRQAGADVSDLKAGGGGNLPAASLAAVSAGLPVYTSYVSVAQTDYALGYQLTGGSFMQVASEQMHLDLLPAARSIYQQANANLAATSAQASGLPWVVIVLVLSLALGYALWRTQRWLSRRTRRTFNFGLLAATLGLLVVAVWLLVSFAAARGDLQRAEEHGSSPAQALAQATITAQRARGDEILNLISRSGATTFKGDFTAAQKEVGPGPGTLLPGAASASTGDASGDIAAAERDAQAWYGVSARVFSLDVAADYAAETKLVIGSGTNSSAAEFGRLEADLGSAIKAGQAVFSSGASAGASAFGGLAIAFGVVAVLMAIGCTWGLSQRLAEYR
jgi:hypothetical protein